MRCAQLITLTMKFTYNVTQSKVLIGYYRTLVKLANQPELLEHPAERSRRTVEQTNDNIRFKKRLTWPKRPFHGRRLGYDTIKATFLKTKVVVYTQFCIS